MKVFRLLLAVLLVCQLPACMPGLAANPSSGSAPGLPLTSSAEESTTPMVSSTPLLTPTPFQPATSTSTPVPPTLTASPTSTPTLTHTPSPTPTPTWIYVNAGKVIVPILLYHHIADPEKPNRYYVSPANFRLQMESLKAWGYTTITPTYLAQVIVWGGELPERPVIITFDDGDLDVYQNAFPVMQELGFVGAAYIVSWYLGATGYMGSDQLLELNAAGWEIGLHGRSHVALSQNHEQVYNELVDSKVSLQTTLGITITTVAYPFGLVDDYVLNKTSEYGYKAGLGLGVLTEHSLATLYYLNRREVHNDMDLQAFAALLPWSTP